MVKDVCWPASPSVRPTTLHLAGSAADCSQASSSHSPLKRVPSANKHTPCPCLLSHFQSPERPQRITTGGQVQANPKPKTCNKRVRLSSSRELQSPYTVPRTLQNQHQIMSLKSTPTVQYAQLLQQAVVQRHRATGAEPWVLC